MYSVQGQKIFKIVSSGELIQLLSVCRLSSVNFGFTNGNHNPSEDILVHEGHAD